ncbi:MAG: TlpA disulfide reductase family protein [Luteibacter sp.]
MSRWALGLGLVLLAGTCAAAAPAQVPSLQVTTLEGKSFDLAQHRGKWVVINWWATWCVPCIKELPEISAFVAAHKDKVVAIGLAFEDSDKADIVEFLKKRPAGFPIAQVDPVDPPKGFGPPLGLPNTYVIAPDGRVAREFLGPVTARDLDAIIASKP